MPSESRDSTTYTSYFVPGYMISRQVMFNNVHYFLGPQASVRAFTYQQREGYLINNPGGPLTKVFMAISTSGISGGPEQLTDSFTEPNRRLAVSFPAVRATGSSEDGSGLWCYELGRLLHQQAHSSAAATPRRSSAATVTCSHHDSGGKVTNIQLDSN